MKIIIIANTVIGKKGNIGFRLQKVLNLVRTEFEMWNVIARGTTENDKRIIHSKFFLFLARFFNAFKIYVWRKFPSRVFEVKIFDYFAYRKLKALVRAYTDSNIQEPILVHLTDPCKRVIEFCKENNIRVILDFPIAPNQYVEDLKQNSTVNLVGNRGLLASEKFCIDNSHTIVTPSVFVADEVRKINAEADFRVVPFGVDRVELQFRDFQHSSKALRFLFVGNVSERKGVPTLLKVWSQFSETSHQLILCGRVYPEIEKLLNDYNFKNVVTPGFVDVKEYYLHSDVYVFPSLMEGSSKSVYEAMNYGLPIITTYESGSIITNGKEGIVVPKLDEVLLLDAINRIISDSRLRKKMSECSRATVKSYTWEKYASEILKIYSEVNSQ